MKWPAATTDLDPESDAICVLHDARLVEVDMVRTTKRSRRVLDFLSVRAERLGVWKVQQEGANRDTCGRVVSSASKKQVVEVNSFPISATRGGVPRDGKCLYKVLTQAAKHVGQPPIPDDHMLTRFEFGETNLRV